MGNQPQQGKQQFRPKKVSKTQVEIACLKVKAHLELVKDRKSHEVMKAEKALAGLVNGSTRNKQEELLLSEKIINDLKYIQACSTLMAYANTLKNFAGMIAESEGQAARLQELMVYIYSIMYASKFLGLFSLDEFRQLMMNFFGTDAVPVSIDLVDPKIEQAFRVKPTPYEVNTYFLEMGNRNHFSLEKINEIHQFSNNPVFNDPRQNQTVPVNPTKPVPNPYQNAPNVPSPYQSGNNPYNTNPYGQPQNNARQDYPAQSNIYDNNPFKSQQQSQEIFPPVPPPVVNPISRPPLVQPPPAFSNFNNVKINDIDKIEDIPLYPDMDMEFKHMGPPGGRVSGNPMQQPADFFPAMPAPTVPSAVVAPPLEPAKMSRNVPLPPVALPVMMAEINPFPDPSAEIFIPPPGPSLFPKDSLMGPPRSYGGSFDASFDQICDQIRKGL